MTRQAVKKELISRGFREFNLDKGLDEFEINYLDCVGTTSFSEQLKWRSFQWVDETGKNIEAELAISHIELDNDSYSYAWHIF